MSVRIAIKIVIKTNMSRHRRTISCATYVQPPGVHPAVVDGSPTGGATTADDADDDDDTD